MDWDKRGRRERERERERKEASSRGALFWSKEAMEVVVTGGEDYVVGCRLAIKTTLGDDIDGTVLAYDSSSKIVVLHILSFSLLFFNWHRSVVLVLRLGFCFPTSGDVAAVPARIVVLWNPKISSVCPLVILLLVVDLEIKPLHSLPVICWWLLFLLLLLLLLLPSLLFSSFNNLCKIMFFLLRIILDQEVNKKAVQENGGTCAFWRWTMSRTWHYWGNLRRSSLNWKIPTLTWPACATVKKLPSGLSYCFCSTFQINFAALLENSFGLR